MGLFISDSDALVHFYLCGDQVKAIIIDMDGTLADVSSIRHYLRGIKANGKPDKNFDKFHEESVNVPPNHWVAEEARYYSSCLGYAILIVTARKHKWRNHTAWWLGLNAIPSDALFMRGNNDNRPDYEVKKDILKRIRDLGYDVKLAFDDNPSVIALWEEEGIDTIRVPGWED